MSDPVTIRDSLDANAVRLDELEKALDAAIDEVDTAEKAWDEAYDKVAEQIEEDWPKDRKSTPPEHLIVSAARRLHRGEYVAWRAAKRKQAKIENQLKAVGRSLSARQTQINADREHERAAGYVTGDRKSVV